MTSINEFFEKTKLPDIDILLQAQKIQLRHLSYSYSYNKQLLFPNNTYCKTLLENYRENKRYYDEYYRLNREKGKLQCEVRVHCDNHEHLVKFYTDRIEFPDHPDLKAEYLLQCLSVPEKINNDDYVATLPYCLALFIWQVRTDIWRGFPKYTFRIPESSVFNFIEYVQSRKQVVRNELKNKFGINPLKDKSDLILKLFSENVLLKGKYPCNNYGFYVNFDMNFPGFCGSKTKSDGGIIDNYFFLPIKWFTTVYRKLPLTVDEHIILSVNKKSGLRTFHVTVAKFNSKKNGFETKLAILELGVKQNILIFKGDPEYSPINWEE